MFFGFFARFSGSGTEFNKYKLLWRLHLEYVEIYKCKKCSLLQASRHVCVIHGLTLHSFIVSAYVTLEKHAHSLSKIEQKNI